MMNSPHHNPVELAQKLIRYPSITPHQKGAIDGLEQVLTTLGFSCQQFRFEDVDNLYARIGDKAPNFCFAGHTDVVPIGDEAAWSVPPFDARQVGDNLIGRGVVDMKGSIAAMISACAQFLGENDIRQKGSISFLITNDEEGPAIHGTRKLLKAIYEKGERLDHCLVGEPTSEDNLGDWVKNGRRGSLNTVVEAIGKQGHAAYPEKSANPVPVLLDFLHHLSHFSLDDGVEGFQPSNLEITSIDVGNPAHNVIPAKAEAKFNIRFNVLHDGNTLTQKLQEMAKTNSKAGVEINLNIRVTGEAFLTPAGDFTALLQRAAESHTGKRAKLSTSGGTSDARFIKDYCPVAELGLKNATAHKVDEQCAVDDIYTLRDIYHSVLKLYFAG